MSVKIAITGGHPSPAFAVIEKLMREKGIEIIFVGRKYALEGDKSLSLEYKLCQEYGLKFYNLTSGKFARTGRGGILRQIVKFFIGLWESFVILRKENPKVILSFGSYLAVPFCLVGFLLGKKIFVHEQTLVPGLANKINSLFAQRVFISFEESRKKFPLVVQKKIELVGNPVREVIFVEKKNPFGRKLEKNGRKVLYFTGGSLGSHSLNLHLFKILKFLVKKYIVIHQTGDVKKYNDYEKAVELKKSLGSLGKYYLIKKHFLAEELGWVYKRADVVVSRAGANTFFELLALEKPVVFIPLPWSAGREQAKQAELFVKAGCGEVFNQYEESEKLLALIERVVKNYDKYKKNFYKLKKIYKEDAASKIISTLLQAV